MVARTVQQWAVQRNDRPCPLRRAGQNPAYRPSGFQFTPWGPARPVAGEALHSIDRTPPRDLGGGSTREGLPKNLHSPWMGILLSTTCAAIRRYILLVLCMFCELLMGVNHNWDVAACDIFGIVLNSH